MPSRLQMQHKRNIPRISRRRRRSACRQLGGNMRCFDWPGRAVSHFMQLCESDSVKSRPQEQEPASTKECHGISPLSIEFSRGPGSRRVSDTKTVLKVTALRRLSHGSLRMGLVVINLDRSSTFMTVLKTERKPIDSRIVGLRSNGSGVLRTLLSLLPLACVVLAVG